MGHDLLVSASSWTSVISNSTITTMLSDKVCEHGNERRVAAQGDPQPMAYGDNPVIVTNQKSRSTAVSVMS
jgi:hypothetical protein